jgi:molybdopterin-guanine dinucleotide biosynthesis protein A
LHLASVILVGGASSRMGADKALLRVRAGGPTMIEAVAERLAEAGLPPALLVANKIKEYGFLGLPVLPDDIAGAGALGGIYTALNHSPAERTLIVACDMPLLNPVLLRYMAALPGNPDLLIPRWHDAEGREQVEPLHAIYSRRCLGPVRRRIEAGKFKASNLLQDVDAQYVDEAELRLHDPMLNSFRNINTPEEWSQYLAGFA